MSRGTKIISWGFAAMLAIATPGLLFAQVGGASEKESIVVNPWVDIVTRLGVPTAFLGFFIWFHIQRQKSHDQALKDKDAIIATKDGEITRINDLRVKEAQASSDRIFERDRETRDLLTEADKTLSMILGKLK